MNLQANYQKYTLHFKFDAGTSRGILKQKDTWFLKVWDEKQPSITGIGEAAPLPGLSIDDRPDFEKKLKEVCQEIGSIKDLDLMDLDWFSSMELDTFPSIKFAVETAFLDMLNGGKRKLFDTPFSSGKAGIPINGLVWMGNKKFMEEQIDEKIRQGFNCIKIKVGALDFKTECELLEGIRKIYSSEKFIIRIDANGAFTAQDALYKIDILSAYSIHSIEQPVKQGNKTLMKKIVQESKIPVALDEELIGIIGNEQRTHLLRDIKPHYIILKPTLLGGLSESMEWINIAEDLNIGWWITSALESNIGLNAIAQFTSSLEAGDFPQGLGTGQLYQNNIASPLVIDKGNLRYDFSKNWEF